MVKKMTLMDKNFYWLFLLMINVLPSLACYGQGYEEGYDDVNGEYFISTLCNTCCGHLEKLNTGKWRQICLAQ